MSARRAADEAREGTVVAHYGVAVVVRFDAGEVARVRVARRARYVVGDRVREGPDATLEVLPQRGVLRRRDTRGRVRAVAANLDVIAIVLAVSPVSPLGYLDRGIVAARALGIAALVVVNKLDLPGADALADEVETTYADSTPVLRCSAMRGSGLDSLADFFAPDRRGVFVGTSGVGKSSLLNALCEGLDLAVGEINEISGLGRHVTSNATLHGLTGGGELIDTPGFRDFGPVEISAGELASEFPGFERALEAPCRFRDCLHRAEPECAVKRAEADGRIEAGRHAAYLELLAELEAVEAARGSGGR